MATAVEPEVVINSKFKQDFAVSGITEFTRRSSDTARQAAEQ